MARRYTQKGKLVIDGLRDLQKGDEIFVSFRGREYVPVKVKNVRQVDCAVIITIEKYSWYPMKYVGYYIDKKAVNGEYVLTLNRWGAERIKEIFDDAEEKWRKSIDNAEALVAVKTIKEWLKK